jgi:hypothetical protein
VHAILEFLPLLGLFIRFLFKKYILKQNPARRDMLPFKTIDYAIGTVIVLVLLASAVMLFPDFLRKHVF